ncbi:sterol desaturase family protein [Vineibacter terrae]|uniref:sterol desaturase family protein n=1 Tax=Vineibacter terrae TaxID=2586908 RepID=UPI0015B7233C|nr:sterol desaturase family protein [Vineibacter terrae]
MDVTETLLAHEAAIRLTAFVAVLVLMAVLEAALPCRQRSVTRWVRWPGNLGIVVLNTALLRLLPVTAAVVALVVEGQGAGLLPALGLPPWAMIVAAMVLLDLAVYLQHVLFHAVPGLWRLHRMHHADLDFDVTTGSRFHPLEILLSMAVKLAVIVAIGAPAAAVVLFEITLNATSMFNHANVRLPMALDRVLRWIVVTPDMHRVHHSIRRPETDSNYGFNLPWWDRVFGTYRAQPADGHDGMTIGLPIFRSVRDSRLDQLLLQPLRNPSAPRDSDAAGFPDGGDARHLRRAG